jgi:hypothetical protein
MTELRDILEGSIGGSLSAIVRALNMIARNTRPENVTHFQDTEMTKFENARNDVFGGPTASGTSVPGFGP